MKLNRPALVAITLGTAAVLAVPASAAGTSITVPAAGPKSVSVSWTGSVPATNLSTTFSDCQGDALKMYDAHKIHVTVPPTAYKVVKAKMSLIVDSSPTLSADFIELVDPSGNSAGTDQQKKEMEVDVTNPAPGDWTALVCSAFTDSVPSHPYQAQIVITTKCKGASPCPAVKPKGKK